MSADLIKLTAAPQTITLGGQDYKVSKLRPRDFGDLSAWLAGRVPDPRVEVRRHMEGLPEAVQIAMWRDASIEAKHWPPSIDSEEGNALLMSPAGQVELIFTALKRHTAGFSREDAERIAESIDEHDLGRLLDLLTGGEPAGPKAEPAEATPPS